MISPDTNRPDVSIDAIAAQLFDSGLTDAERADLLKRLSTDAQACDQLVDYMMLHAALRRELGSHRPETLSESLFSEQPTAVPAPLPTGAEADVNHPLTGFIQPSPALGFFTFNALGWTFFAALLAVVVVSTLWTVGSWRHQEANVAQVAVEKSFPVSSVRIDSGTANLALPNVGYVIVEGPAEFELIDAMRARLNRGRIKMRVTEKSGHGFTVETPFGNVMDLGTEFGLDVSEKGQAGVVVFDGAVDLQVAESSEKPDFSRVERLERGDGLTFREGGKLDRIMSIVTGAAATFQQRREPPGEGHMPVILQVADNRRTSETKKFYEIVSGGLREDAQAYVDRPEHEWNGVTSEGLPPYLVGADYVKPFNDDKIQSDIEINVTLGCPAKLYVLFDDRLPTPDWLKKSFQKTNDKIGLDVGDWKGSKRHNTRADGPGMSIDERFSIWERNVTEAGVVTLGPNTTTSNTQSGMYGIAAVAIDVRNDDFKGQERHGN